GDEWDERGCSRRPRYERQHVLRPRFQRAPLGIEVFRMDVMPTERGKLGATYGVAKDRTGGLHACPQLHQASRDRPSQVMRYELRDRRDPREQQMSPICRKPRAM